MTTAFQLGAFQFGAFQIDPVWDGTTVLTRAPYGINWSRKRFREWLEAKRAQEAVEAKARESTGKRRQALEAAASKAEAALDAIEAEAHEAAHATQLVALTNALDAARGAKYVADVVRAANAAKVIAEEMQDEEEAIAFLLLNG